MDKASEEFVKTLEEFCESADTIFNVLNKLLEEYLLGKDVRDNIRAFRERNRKLFQFIHDMLTDEEHVKKWLLEIKLDDDKRWTISKLKSYRILGGEFRAVYYEDFDIINPITSIEAEYDYNEQLKTYLVEIRAQSFGKEIFRSKIPLDWVIWLSTRLLEEAHGCLKEFADEPLSEDSIKSIKEFLEYVVKYSNEISESLKEEVPQQ